MNKPEKTGRNDPCPCGSGRKFKRCCEARQQHGGLGSRFMLAIVVSAVIAAIVLGFVSLTRGPAATGPRQVWSPEHGHYHDVP